MASVTPKRIPPGSKRANVLRTILDRGAQGLNCFEAVRLSHDYVLRSTISDLTRGYGITFARKREQVPGHAGSKVECVRYWLAGPNVAMAKKLLDLPCSDDEELEALGAFLQGDLDAPQASRQSGVAVP